MVLGHVAAIVAEFIVYGKLLMIFGEVFLGWGAIYCYLSLTDCAMYIYIFALFASVIMGVLNIGTLFSSGLSFIVFPCQLCMYTFGGYYLYLKFSTYKAALKNPKNVKSDLENAKSSAED